MNDIEKHSPKYQESLREHITSALTGSGCYSDEEIMQIIAEDK